MLYGLVLKAIAAGTIKEVEAEDEAGPGAGTAEEITIRAAASPVPVRERIALTVAKATTQMAYQIAQLGARSATSVS